MARVFPTEIPAEWHSAGERAELETLAELRKLPDAYTVYYSQNWIDIKPHGLFQGEIDFVIVREDGAVIFLEQKAGTVEIDGDMLVAKYTDRNRDILNQRHRNESHFRRRLREALGADFARRIQINSLMYFPNCEVKVPKGADLDPSQVHHAGSSGTLRAFIEANAFPHPDVPHGAAEALRKFLRATLNIRPSLTRCIDEQKTIYRSMTGGVAELLVNFEMHPLRLRICGTAGCGKTQYGLTIAEHAAEADQRVLYLCFNRLLAEEVQRRAPDGVIAETFHRFCERLHAENGTALPETPGGKAQREYFDALEASAEAILLGPFDLAEHGFDLVIVDEGQDFREAWFQQLEVLLRDEHAGILWMEDPEQRVQRSRDFKLPDGFATWNLRTNYRTSRRIAEFISKTLELDYQASGGRLGFEVARLPWSDEAEQTRLIDGQVREWIKQGVPPEQIAIITMRGQFSSPLCERAEIGGLPLRQATSEYTEDGHQIFTDGELLLETVRRFKGLEAPCVIVADINPADGQDMDDYRRLLFVAMSRAMTGLAVAYRSDSAVGEDITLDRHGKLAYEK